MQTVTWLSGSRSQAENIGGRAVAMRALRSPDVRGGRAHPRVAALLVAAALLIPAASPAVAGGAVPYTFDFGIGGCYVSGLAPINDSFTVTVRDPIGRFKASEAATADGSGNWSLDNCLGRDIESGDKITASDGTHTRTFTVPVLSVAANRVSDVVSGYAPASSTVHMTLYCSASGCPSSIAVNASTTSAGKFSHDFTAAHDVKGGDYVYVYWTSAHADSVYVYGYFPNFSVTVGRSEFQGNATPNQVATLTLKHGSTVKGTAKAVGNAHGGYFSADFRKANGSPALVEIGDTIVPSFAGAVTLPTVSVAGHASTDLVTGTCPANRPFEAYAHDPTYPYRANYYSYQDGFASGTGHVSVDMSSGYYNLFNLMSKDEVILSCTLGSGDELSISAFVP
jgi:hypothetical protein